MTAFNWPSPTGSSGKDLSLSVDGDDMAALLAAGIDRRMSRAGNCDDNAAMALFWSTLKSDTGLDESIPSSRHHIELAVFDSIERFAKRSRRRRSLGNGYLLRIRKMTSTKHGESLLNQYSFLRDKPKTTCVLPPPP